MNGLSRLQALVQRLGALAGSTDVQASQALLAQANSLTAVLAAPEPANQADAERWSVAMIPMAQQLLACGAAVHAALPHKPCAQAALLQFTAAVHLASTALVTVQKLPVGPAAANAAVSCVGLLLGTGRACLSWRDRGGALATLAPQITLMRLVFEAALQADMLSQLASDHAPVQSLTAWLSLVVDGALAVTKARADQGLLADVRLVLPDLVPVCHTLMAVPECSAHAAAISRNASLAARLVQLLAPAFLAAAAGQLLPANRRSAQRGGWRGTEVGCLAAVLAMPQLRTGLAAYMTENSPGIGANALQLLRPACQLLSQGLQGSEAETENIDWVLLDGCWLLIGAASAVLAVSSGCEGSGWFEQRSQQVSKLLLLLPACLAPSMLWREPPLSTGGAQPPESMPAFIADAMAEAAALLSVLSHPPSDHSLLSNWPLGSLPDWQSWCAAASTMLHSLPALAELAQRRGAQLSNSVTRLVKTGVKLVSSTAHNVRYWAACWGGPACGPLPQLAGLDASMFQLHTDACRAAHWSEHTGALQPGRFELTLLLELASPLLAAAQLPSQPAAAAPCLSTMAAAHCAAVQALLSRPERMQQLMGAQPENATTTMEALAAALAALPQAAALDPGLPSLLARLIAASLKIGGWSYGHLLVLRTAGNSFEMIAHLIASGAMEASLQSLGSSQSAGDEELRVASQVLARLVNAAAAVPQTALQQHGMQAIAELSACLTDFSDADVTRAAAAKQLRQRALPPAARLAAALLDWWRRPEQQQANALALAQAAAGRSCAYLRCANLGGEGGPAAGQGVGSMRCSACRAVWYCGTACSHADWREGGHRRVCKALGAARAAAKAARAAAAAGTERAD